MTIGDVLAVIAAVVLVAASWGATLLMVALAFRCRAATAQDRIASAPGSAFGVGLAAIILVAIAAALLNRSHAGPVRIMAGALLTGLVALAAVGSAGIIRLLSDRIQEVGSPMTPFSALTRSAFLYVSAGFVPIFGWFIVLPAAACLSVGGGVAAVQRRSSGRGLESLRPGDPALAFVSAGGPGLNGAPESNPGAVSPRSPT